MDRTELLNKIYASRTRLEAALQALADEQMTMPDLPSGWSVKDLLAHLGRWEEHAVYLYEASTNGETPDTPHNEEQVEDFNAKTIELFRARDLDSVRDYERRVYHDLLNVVETIPENDLFNPRRFDWTKGRPFVTWIAWNTYEHYQEHLPALENKLAENLSSEQHPPLSGPVEQGGRTVKAPLSPYLQKARAFLEQEGRDIDRAIFDHRFGSLSSSEVLDVLARYQNADGGFTRLEVDIQAPQSNPFATELALTMLVWIDPPRDHPLVRRTLAYLDSTQDDGGNWRFTQPIYQHGLAPWFQGWKWPNLNPSCTTAGFLKQLGLGSDRLHRRVQALFAQLAKPEDLAGNDFYSARPYALYLQTEWSFPQADFYRWGTAWWMVRQHISGAMDATHWMEYVPRPESALTRRLPVEIVNAKLDQLLGEQSEDGGWPTPYDPRWRSWFTVQNLLILRAHGKI